MGEVLQPVAIALACPFCGRRAVTFDYPRLNVRIPGAASATFSYADEIRDPNRWSRIKIWCEDRRHRSIYGAPRRYERTLRLETMLPVIKGALLEGDFTTLPSRSRRDTQIALQRGDIDQREASAQRRHAVAVVTIRLDAF